MFRVGAFVIHLVNYAAADDGVAVIKDDRLSGGDGALGCIKPYRDVFFVDRLDRSGGGRMAVTDLDLGANGCGGRRASDPVDLTCC